MGGTHIAAHQSRTKNNPTKQIGASEEELRKVAHQRRMLSGTSVENTKRLRSGEDFKWQISGSKEVICQTTADDTA